MSLDFAEEKKPKMSHFLQDLKRIELTIVFIFKFAKTFLFK